MTIINHPMVSVIIPAYNAAEFLAATIASVQKQTFSDWELLIINDGSTDDTVAVVREYQETNHNIHLIHQLNQGVSSARNLGVEKSKGQIIAFLDADDQWLPNKLQQHLEHFQSNSRLGVSFAQVEILTQAGEPTGQVSSSRLTASSASSFCLRLNSLFANDFSRAILSCSNCFSVRCFGLFLGISNSICSSCSGSGFLSLL